MYSNIRPRLNSVFCRKYQTLPVFIIEDKVADALTDMLLVPPPDEVVASPGKYYEWAYTVIDRALSHEAKRLLRFVTITEEQLDADDELDRFTNEEAVESCLRELPSKEREIIIIRMYTAYSYEKIAAILGRSPSMIRKLYNSAMERLKSVITPSRNNHASGE